MEEINNTNLVEDIDIELNSTNTEKMNYEKKLKKCEKRVYGCKYSDVPRSTKKLEERIDRSYKEDTYIKKKKPKFDMNEDVDSIIQIAVSYFWLPPDIADRAKLIMARMWSYPDNFHDLKYENVVLGILMYIVNEIPDDEIGIPDFNGYCTYMFGTVQAERNIRQMYEASEIVSDLYPEVEREFQLLAQEIWKRKRKLYI